MDGKQVSDLFSLFFFLFFIEYPDLFNDTESPSPNDFSHLLLSVMGDPSFFLFSPYIYAHIG